MINPEQRKLLQELKNTAYGKALLAFLEDKYAEIGDINSIPNDGNIPAETLGRKFALKLLKDLFGFMEERKSTERKPNQYV